MNETDELEEILARKKEELLKKIKAESNKTVAKETEMDLKKYVPEKVVNYLEEKYGGDKEKIEEIYRAIRFLVREKLISRPLTLEAVLFIARRVLHEEPKIRIINENEEVEL